MGFFEAPEVAEEDTDEFEPPAWVAPPRRVLGRAAAAQQAQPCRG
jgi:hypothetical protein